MPKRVYNNVEDHRLICGKTVVEDVTSVTLPTLTNPTTKMSASGMAVDIDVPNMVHLDAMEYSVSHNNGIGSTLLGAPGKQTHEFRVVRQRYNVAKGEIEHESVKFRLTGLHKESGKGTIETGNPYGSTDKFSLLRYEEEQDGAIVTLIDATAGIIRHNGKDYTDVVQNMLK